MNPIVKEIEPIEVKRGLDSGEIILIDVREFLEYSEEHLAKAHLFPLSHFKPELLPDPAGKKLLFYCQHGRRSTTAALKWAEHAAEAQVLTLKGGVAAWKKAGFPTVADSVISRRIERQAYVLSGLIVLLGVALSWFVSDWFLILPLFIAILLLLSGLLGHCLYSFLLSMLPWNR